MRPGVSPLPLLPAPQTSVLSKDQESSQHPVAAKSATQTESTRNRPLYRQGNGERWRKLLKNNLQGDHTPHPGNASLKTPEGPVIGTPSRNAFDLLNPETQEPVLGPGGQTVRLMQTDGGYVPVPELKGGFAGTDIPGWVLEGLYLGKDKQLSWADSNGSYCIRKESFDRVDDDGRVIEIYFVYDVYFSSNDINWEPVLRLKQSDLPNLIYGESAAG